MAKSGSVAKAAGKSRATGKRNAVADALEDVTLDADSRQSAHDEEAVLDGGDKESEGDPPPPPRTVTVTRATVAGNDAGAPEEVLHLRVQKRTKERDEAEKERDAAIKAAETLKREIEELEAAAKMLCSILIPFVYLLSPPPSSAVAPRSRAGRAPRLSKAKERHSMMLPMRHLCAPQRQSLLGR